jgi:hypothetical protein
MSEHPFRTWRRDETGGASEAFDRCIKRRCYFMVTGLLLFLAGQVTTVLRKS